MVCSLVALQPKNIGVIMPRNKSLTDLKHIGRKIAGRLNEVGVFSEDDLRLVGVIGAHRMIKEKHPNETLPVCYYLYSFEGALSDKHWDEIGEKRKQQLRAQIQGQLGIFVGIFFGSEWNYGDK